MNTVTQLIVLLFACVFGIMYAIHCIYNYVERRKEDNNKGAFISLLLSSMEIVFVVILFTEVIERIMQVPQ